MQRKWKPGDPVVVTTVNKGLPVLQQRKGAKRQDKSASWAGVIVGPSLVGPGWWIVRRLSARGDLRGSSTYAVPNDEIVPRKR